MNIKYIIAIFCLSIITTSDLFAQVDKKNTSLKSGTKYLKLLESSSQRILPGRPGMQPSTEYHFILAWQSKESPSTFFWRGDGSWISCRAVKAHKIKHPQKKNDNVDEDYITESISNIPFKKGDTIEITPIPGGKFSVPKEIPANAVNTIFFKTFKSNWLSFPVKKITVKPDIAMP